MDTKTKRADPVVVVIGNATLLGIGYIAQRRFRAAAIAVIGAAALLVPMAQDPEAHSIATLQP